MRNFLFLLVVMSTLIVAGCDNSAAKMTTEKQEKLSSSPTVNSSNSFSDTSMETSKWVTGVTEDPNAPKDQWYNVDGDEFTNDIHEEDYDIGNFKEYWTDDNTFYLEDYAKANGADNVVLLIDHGITSITIHFWEWEVVVGNLGVWFFNPENVEYEILPHLPETIDESYWATAILSDGETQISRTVLGLLNKTLSLFKNRTDDISDPFVDSNLRYKVSYIRRRK